VVLVSWILQDTLNVNMPSPAVNSCLNILRRTPVKETEQNVAALATLLSDEEGMEDLFQRVDSPLKIASDPSAKGKKYLLIDHSRDGESYRSPWSNEYFPPIPPTDDGGVGAFKPSRSLRNVECIANEVFESYCDLYYGKGDHVVSSVYLWDKEEMNDSSNAGGAAKKGGFAGCFLISKRLNDDNGEKESGFWNSIHIVDSGPIIDGTSKYKLTTTLLLAMNVVKSSSTTATGEESTSSTTNELQIAGSLTKQVEKTCAVVQSSSGTNNDETGHIRNIGQMIEEIETEMRSNMDSLHIQKTKQVMDSIHCNSGVRKRSSLMADMMTRNGRS